MIKSDGLWNSLFSEVVRSTVSWVIRIDCTRPFTKGNHSSITWLDKHRSSKSLVPNNPIICWYLLWWHPLIIWSVIQIQIFVSPLWFCTESADFSNISKNTLSRSPDTKGLWRKLCKPLNWHTKHQISRERVKLED